MSDAIEDGGLGTLMIPENFDDLPKPHQLWFIDEHEQWIEENGHLIQYANLLNDVTARCKNRDNYNSFQNRQVFVLLRATPEEKIEAFKRLDVVLNGTDSHWSNQRLDYVKEANQCQE